VQDPFDIAVAAWWRARKNAGANCQAYPSTLPSERTDWLLRKLAGKMKPMRENFLVFALRRSSNVSSPHSGLGMLRRLKPDTSDPDPQLPENLLDTRLEFLDKCQRNRWQFDQLRRAKFSSAMIIKLLRDSQETA